MPQRVVCWHKNTTDTVPYACLGVSSFLSSAHNPDLNMPTAQGTISLKQSQIAATFLIDSVPFKCVATMTLALSDFEAPAVLTYDNKDELTGLHPFTGKVGLSTYEINVDNGPTITGTLNPPVAPAHHINGMWMWGKLD
ncbi:hypothetical protein BDW22DRAFT_1485978 [Trametopsis cervina]|nr:hypothetical protein BDW22DRAFT_1485978 [Trametopsis cervina]